MRRRKEETRGGETGRKEGRGREKSGEAWR